MSYSVHIPVTTSASATSSGSSCPACARIALVKSMRSRCTYATMQAVITTVTRAKYRSAESASREFREPFVMMRNTLATMPAQLAGENQIAAIVVSKFWTYSSVCCACAQRPGLPRVCHPGLLACLALQAMLSAHVACTPRARLRQSFSRTLTLQKTINIFQWVQNLGTWQYFCVSVYVLIVCAGCDRLLVLRATPFVCIHFRTRLPSDG